MALGEGQFFNLLTPPFNSAPEFSFLSNVPRSLSIVCWLRFNILTPRVQLQFQFQVREVLVNEAAVIGGKEHWESDLA